MSRSGSKAHSLLRQSRRRSSHSGPRSLTMGPTTGRSTYSARNTSSSHGLQSPVRSEDNYMVKVPEGRPVMVMAQGRVEADAADEKSVITGPSGLVKPPGSSNSESRSRTVRDGRTPIDPPLGRSLASAESWSVGMQMGCTSSICATSHFRPVLPDRPYSLPSRGQANLWTANLERGTVTRRVSRRTTMPSLRDRNDE